MKGRHCPRLPGPGRLPQQGVNADAADSRFCLLHLLREASRERRRQSLRLRSGRLQPQPGSKVTEKLGKGGKARPSFSLSLVFVQRCGVEDASLSALLGVIVYKPSWVVNVINHSFSH